MGAGTAITEQHIKRALDGTFTRVPSGRDGKGLGKRAPVRRGSAWTERENLIVIQMLNEQFTQVGIAERLGRGVATINGHVNALRKAGRL